MYVLYTGKNRNRSIISKEVVEKALYSLKNIPVVGEWKEENENFGKDMVAKLRLVKMV